MYEYVKPQQDFLDGRDDYGVRRLKSASARTPRPAKHIGNDIRVSSNVLQRKVLTSDGKEVYNDTEEGGGSPGGVPLSIVMEQIRDDLQSREDIDGDINEIMSEVRRRIIELISNQKAKANVKNIVDRACGQKKKAAVQQMEKEARSLFIFYTGKSAEDLKELCAEEIREQMREKGFLGAAYDTSKESSVNDNLIVQTHPIGTSNPLYKDQRYKDPLLFVEIHPKGGIHASSYILFTFKTKTGAAERYKVIFSKKQNYVGDIGKEQNTTHLRFLKENITFPSKAEIEQQAKASGGAPPVGKAVPGTTGAKPKGSVGTGINRSHANPEKPARLSQETVEGLGKVKVGAFAKRHTLEAELFQIEREQVPEKDRERIQQAYPYLEAMNIHLRIGPLSVQHVMQLLPYTEDGAAFWSKYNMFRQNHPEFRYELSPVQVINCLDNRHPRELYIMDDEDWIRYDEFKAAHTEFIYSL